MKLIKRTLAAALLAAITLAPAITASAYQDIVPVDAPVAVPYTAPARLPDNILVAGVIEEIGENSLRIVSSSGDIDEIVVHIGETTRILGAADALPVGFDTLKTGDFVYAYINNFMTMSLPPQAGAQLILCNAPQDYRVPSYHTVLTTEMSEDGATLSFTTDKGEQFTFTENVALSPFMTRNMVYLQNIVPGTRLLIWQSAGTFDEPATVLLPTKAVLFAYEYDGYFEIEGETLFCTGETVDLADAPILTGQHGETLLPLRAVCEALGWTVSWDAEARCAIVSCDSGLFFVWPGKEIGEVGQTNVTFTTVPEIIGGLTMVSARDLAYFLNMFYAGV